MDPRMSLNSDSPAIIVYQVWGLQYMPQYPALLGSWNILVMSDLDFAENLYNCVYIHRVLPLYWPIQSSLRLTVNHAAIQLCLLLPYLCHCTLTLLKKSLASFKASGAAATGKPLLLTPRELQSTVPKCLLQPVYLSLLNLNLTFWGKWTYLCISTHL